MRKHIIASLCLWAVACSDGAEKGNVSFTTWGEPYIEDGIPAVDVIDGWSIRYSKFLFVLSNVKIADEGGAVAAQMTTPKLFDHTKKGVKPVVVFTNIEAKAWTRVSYEIAPTAATAQLAGATEADKALMVAGGYSIYLEASASKGAVTKSFKWGFKTATLYDRCKGEVGGKETDGVVVTNGGTDEPQLTIHADHFYYDDLQSRDAKVRFDNIAAADANNDGDITLAELGAVKLVSLPTGADQGTYGTGNRAVSDLGTFVSELSRTLGHFRGEGECFAAAK